MRKKYGEKYEDQKNARMKKNPDAISLGHLDISKRNFELFRKFGIYTIGDFQRMSDAEMLKIPGIGDSTINRMKKQLLRLKIARYKKDEDRIEVLGLSPGRREILEEMGISTLTNLSETEVGDLLDKSEIGVVSTEKILITYLMEQLVRQEAQEMLEIELYRKVKLIMIKIKEKTENRKRKFKDILEDLRRESGIEPK